MSVLHTNVCPGSIPLKERQEIFAKTSGSLDDLTAIYGQTKRIKEFFQPSNLDDTNYSPDITSFNNLQLKIAKIFLETPASLNELNENLDLQIEPINQAAFKSVTKAQKIIQIIKDKFEIDPTIAIELLSSATLLHANAGYTRPLIADFLDLEKCGLNVQYSKSKIVSSKIIDNVNYNSHAIKEWENVDTGIWTGYLIPPNSETYNIFIEKDYRIESNSEPKSNSKSEPNVEVEIFLGGDKKISLRTRNDSWYVKDVQLEAKRFYQLRLSVKNLNRKLKLKWESKSLKVETISIRNFYPYDPSPIIKDCMRLAKVCSIVKLLQLSNKEIVHFGSLEIFNERWLNKLQIEPLQDNQTDQQTIILKSFVILLEMMRYKQLKKNMKIQDDALIELLERYNPELNNNQAADDYKNILENNTKWNIDDLRLIFNKYKLIVNDSLPVAFYEQLHKFIRAYEVFAIAEKIGIPVSDLYELVINNPDAASVQSLQTILRINYPEDAWQAIMKDINDPLRNKQRDAMVAYVLQKLPENAGVDTADKLFEYLLIDVQMDCCMKTSRIKQAISSVQLFVQRCLLNLENGISPTTINVKQWEWMKRYRLWEANRKIFLYPENWLEPELRDNKTPFFKDFEGELLQADITEDTATTALLHYLEKLDEIAKLEICGMYYSKFDSDNQEVASNTDDDRKDDNGLRDKIHIIGKTSGAKRKYYYRRFENESWTPWEKMDLNIEDNPIIPVWWKGRLFAFWLSIRQEAMDKIGLTTEETNENVENNEIQIKLTLHWSEYYNAKWQPTKTSDINKPIILTLGFTSIGNTMFDRNKLFLNSIKGKNNETLRIEIQYMSESPGVRKVVASELN